MYSLIVWLEYDSKNISIVWKRDTVNCALWISSFKDLSTCTLMNLFVKKKQKKQAFRPQQGRSTTG